MSQLCSRVNYTPISTRQNTNCQSICAFLQNSLVSLNILTLEEAISASAEPQDQLTSRDNQLTSTIHENNLTDNENKPTTDEKCDIMTENNTPIQEDHLTHAQSLAGQVKTKDQQLIAQEKPEACPNLTFVWLNNFIG